MKKAKKSLRPLGERVLVKRLAADATSDGGIIIPDNAREKPQKGVVIKLGRKKNNDIKENDVIVFANYAGTELILDKEIYLILGIDEIIAIEE